MERKIGEVFEYQGHKLKVVESDGCCHRLCNQEEECFFSYGSTCKKNNKFGSCCISQGHVCFVEVTNEEKDMKKLDLTKILKVGDKVWSPILGECIVRLSGEDTNGHTILVATPDGQHDTTFNEEGKYFSYSPECTLFPSREYRVWDEGAVVVIRPPKKGDYLISGNNNCFIYNGIHEFGKYGAIVGAIREGYITFDSDDKSANFTSRVVRYATPEEIKEFDKLLKSKGYYFDKEKLELKKLRWRAKCGEKYWFINSSGMISTEYECDIISNNKRYDLGNYFKTLEDAEKALKQIKQLFKSIHNENN